MMLLRVCVCVDRGRNTLALPRVLATQATPLLSSAPMYCLPYSNTSTPTYFKVFYVHATGVS